MHERILCLVSRDKRVAANYFNSGLQHYGYYELCELTVSFYERAIRELLKNNGDWVDIKPFYIERKSGEYDLPYHGCQLTGGTLEIRVFRHSRLHKLRLGYAQTVEPGLHMRVVEQSNAHRGFRVQVFFKKRAYFRRAFDFFVP